MMRNVLCRNARVRPDAGRLVWAALLLCAAAPSFAEVSFTPAWQVASDLYPTGVGWADIDGDGFLDLVVANGLDAANTANQVYFNESGELGSEPGWVSLDTAASGNLFVGDLSGDKRPDLVTATLGHNPTGRAAAPHTVYRNRGGGLSQSPSWLSVPGNGFSLAVADVDCDGDLDIAFGQGFSAVDPANAKRLPSVVYFNEGGDFGDLPGWESDSTFVAVDIEFADVDNDGDPDLALTGRGHGVLLFENRGGVLERSPSWRTDEILGGRQMAFGDVDGDGFPELAVCAVVGYGEGGGEFVLFKNRGGVLEKKPSWSCGDYPEPAAVAWADADGDGDLDLGAAGWNLHVGVFENEGGVLSERYAWMHTPGWVQQIAWADYDENGLVPDRGEFVGDGRRTLFQLPARAIHEITSVEVGGERLAAGRYCEHLADGWVSLASPPAPGERCVVEYVRSTNLDLAVTTIGRIRVYENRPQVIPEGVRVLALADHEFGANVNFSYDHPLAGPVSNNILAHFDRYRWDVTIAGPEKVLDSCSVSAAPLGSRSITVDTLVSEIHDISSFDCLVILPGRDPSGLAGDEHVLRLVRSAVHEGLVTAAWCRSVRVLAAADVIRGRTVTGHEDYRREYEEAGATYAGEDAPPVTDGTIVTSVRSRFYRTEMCEAIAAAALSARATR